MKPITKSKLAHFYLNLDYPIHGYDVAAQANIHVSVLIHRFLRAYGTKFTTKTFIYEYGDDLYSLIGYHILLGISEVTDFKFVLYGRPRKTKQYIVKTQKVLSKREFNKMKSNAILLSHYNPIYKVLNIDGASNVFEDAYSIVEQLTPSEIFALKKFYEYKHIPHQYFYKSDPSMEAFQQWAEFPLGKNLLDKDKYIKYPLPIMNLVYIDNKEDDISTKNNVLVLQTIEQSEDMNFYFYKVEDTTNKKIPSILYDLNYQTSVKMRSNIPNEKYGNINCLEIIKDLARAGATYQFIGDWPVASQQKIDRILKGENIDESIWD